MHRIVASALSCFVAAGSTVAAAPPPNVVLIFTDDQGYGDLGCYGSETIRTPNLDRLAREGRRFTSFMVASPVCSPSRAALLTGCYPKRVGMHRHVLFPTSTTGLHPAEHTLADQFKGQGYATACFGKWHLGHLPEVLPRAQGFDAYFGIPYSNDMNHPDNKGQPPGGPAGMDALWADPESSLTKWKTPLYENEEIVELPVDQRTVTRRYTQRAIDFIRGHRDGPFFVYLPHSMPHIPLSVPDDVRDSDPHHSYTNTIEHVDAEVGRLLDTLDELGLAENTFVIYASDNGPWLSFKHHGGSAGPLRDGKGTTFEGGQRVPCLIRGPGIPAGTVCDALTGTIDVLPTLVTLTGGELPPDRRIDGLDVSGLWRGEIEASPREAFLYYTSHGEIEGIREGSWKLLVKRPPRGKQAAPGAAAPESQVMLFDLERDLGERTNVAGEHPDLVARLRVRMQELDREITANARPQWSRDAAVASP
jgi:arylsulfatase A-like enzyme